ncbi:BID domain-containing T4SS effector [Bartonella sp. TS25HLJMH]|uniref:BID domain-containing T4SS effector n=1 Tax=Bartonella sp. TS25HLJMH TaxID=3243576 RepID=UPI0035CEF5EC
MKINLQSPSKKPSIQGLRQRFEQTNQGSNPEPIYAKVNKPRGKQPKQSTIYAPQTPLGTIYAPQNPPESAYATPRGGPDPQKRVDPYAITDLQNLGGGSGYYSLKNPLYEGSGIVQNGGHSQEPQLEEHIYEEVEVGGNGEPDYQRLENPLYQTSSMVQNGQPPHPQLEEHIYEEVNVGGNGGPDYQRLENPLYQTSSMVENSQNPQQPTETIYAPQNPPESAYAAPRGGQNPRKLVDPYAVTDLRDLGEYEVRENPLYEGIDTVKNGGHTPQGPTENASAEGPTPNRTTPLTKKQVTKNLQEDLRVQYGADEVCHWSRIVFGNPNALQEQLTKILENPEQGRQIAQDVAADPESVGKLAGRKVLGIKSPQRKHAEEGVKSLSRVLKRHAETVETQYKSLTKSQEKQKDLERGESPERRATQRTHHHHHHHAREQRQNPPQHDVQSRRQQSQKGVAFAL